MSASIEFEAKTDRELLVLVAQKSNESTKHLARINGTISDHERRLGVVEGKTKMLSNPSGFKWKANWQLMVWIASVVSLIIVTLGDKVAWW